MDEAPQALQGLIALVRQKVQFLLSTKRES